MPKPVFISHSTDDAPMAGGIRDALEAAGIGCWMAPRDIAPGEDYAEQIINAIEACDVLVLVLSETSNQSRYVRNEVERAIAKQKTVIPFRIHNVTPSRSLEFFVSNAQWIEAWQGPIESAIGALRLAVGRFVADVPVAHKSRSLPAANAVKVASPGARLVADSDMVGRARESAELSQLLRAPTTRLVTLLGPGGIGKSTLAASVAISLRDDFRDGVVEVALAALTRGDQIYAAIAEAMQMKLASELPSAQQMMMRLAGKHLLLVLDNVEQLVDGADHIKALLDGAPLLRILTTSRERLNLRDENLFKLEGLAVPGQDANASNDSISLFLRHAHRANPTLLVDPPAMAQIAQICRLVDGMPLAIMLAASSADALSLVEIGAEVAKRLDVLETTMRDVPARQRSMRGVLDSMWARLSPAEQQAFARLSLFCGGFTREAGLAVTGMSVRTLISLNGKSLLHQVGGRTTIHELLRQFGAEKLIEAGAYGQTQTAYSAHFLGWLATSERALQSRDARVLSEVDADFENLRQAWGLSVQASDEAALGGCLDALVLFCSAHHRVPDAHVLLSKALASPCSLPLRIRLLRHRVITSGAVGVFAQEVEDAEAILRLDPDPPDKQQTIQVLMHQGIAKVRLGAFGAGESILDRALSLARDAKSARAESEILFQKGMVRSFQYGYARAHELLRESEQLAVENGFGDEVAARVASGTGKILVQQGKMEMWETFEKALVVARRRQDRYYELVTLSEMSYGAALQGRQDWRAAIACANMAIELADQLQVPHEAMWAHCGLGILQTRLGNVAAGQDAAVHCMNLGKYQGDPFVVVWGAVCLGEMYLAIGMAQRAADAFDMVEQALLGRDGSTSLDAFMVAMRSAIQIGRGEAEPDMLRRLETHIVLERRMDRYHGLACLLPVLCDYHLSRRDFAPALNAAQDALEIAQHQQMRDLHTRALVCMGRAKFGLGQVEAGLTLLAEALANAQTDQAHFLHIEAHRALQRVCESTGDEANAGAHRAGAEALIDQLRENLKDLPELQAGLHTL